MGAEDRLFRFSLGPVGGFIGEARRTRDWWAGSFLLSWLSAAAIRAAHENGAKILSPFTLEPGTDASSIAACPDPFFRAVCGEATRLEYEASLTNQFRAIVPEDFSPKVCRAAVLDRWQALSAAVWEKLVKPALEQDEADRVKPLWDGQIGTGNEGFWETIWVKGAAPDDPFKNMPDVDWMAMRKRRRDPPFVGDLGDGDLCSLMPMFREISGYSRSAEASKQKTFWTDFREGLDTRGKSLDLRPGERLSAPALVKRLFPRLPRGTLGAKSLIGWEPRSADLWEERLKQNWNIQRPEQHVNLRFWPSTAAIAAEAWMHRVCNQMAKEDGTDLGERVLKFVESVEGLGGQVHRLRTAERQSRIQEEFVYPGAATKSQNDLARRFCALDGKLLYGAEYAGGRLAEDLELDLTSQDDLKRLERVAKNLRAICDISGSAPSAYFAVIQADGDEIGKLLVEHPDTLPDSLRGFNADVRKAFFGGEGTAPTVRGDLLFSSADELIAVASVENALAAVNSIRTAWAAQNKKDVCVTG